MKAPKMEPETKNIILEKNRNNLIVQKDTLESDSQEMSNRHPMLAGGIDDSGIPVGDQSQSQLLDASFVD